MQNNLQNHDNKSQVLLKQGLQNNANAAADSGSNSPITTNNNTVQVLDRVEDEVALEEQEQEQEQEQITVTTAEVQPVKAISPQGIIGLKGAGSRNANAAAFRYAMLMEIGGLNAGLMSGSEKNSLVRRFSMLLNTTSNAQAVYCVSKPNNLLAELARLDKQREQLPLQERGLREQNFITRDHLVRKQRERAITRRKYYYSMEASTSDLKSANSEYGTTIENEANSDPNDDGQNALKRLGFFKSVAAQYMISALGQDQDEVIAKLSATKNRISSSSNNSNKANTTNQGALAAASALRKNSANTTTKKREAQVPPGLADTLGFKVQSLADQLGMNGLPAKTINSRFEVLRVLTEQLGSNLTFEELTTLAKLEKNAATAITTGNSSNGNKDGSATNNNNASADAWLDNEIVGQLLGKGDFQEYPKCLKIGNDWVSSVVVTKFPNVVRFGHNFKLVRFRDIRMNVALHFRPLSFKEAETKLKKKQQILVAVQMENKSQVADFSRLHKIESLKQLRTIVETGEAHIFEVMMVVAVRSTSRKRMYEDLRRVANRLTEQSYEIAYPYRNQRRAFFSAIPLGHNYLADDKLIADRYTHPNSTAENVICLMPNCVADFVQPGGIIEGSNKDDGSLVTYNRWLKTATNPHTIVIATTGGGKTVSIEHEFMQEFLKDFNLEGYAFDPQNVLGPFARMVGGIVVDLSLTGKACINPLGRFIAGGAVETIGERLIYLYALFAQMMGGDLSKPEKNVVGNALKRLYHHFEEGEDALGTLLNAFAKDPFFSALHPYLTDYPQEEQNGQVVIVPGIISRLQEIYQYLAEKHKLPRTGLVAGAIDPITGKFSRPICRLYDGKWWYCGEGETDEPFVEPEEIKNIPFGKSKPPAVWHPHPEWRQPLFDKFYELVIQSQVFAMLDTTARDVAIRNAAIPLKLGEPILSDLLPYLCAEGAAHLAANLEEYVDPERLGPLFNGYTNVDLDKRFISWNIKDLDENTLRPIRMFQVVSLIWSRVRAFRRRRIFLVDEFQSLVQRFRDVAAFVRDMFQRGRFFRLAMIAVVQNISAFVDYPEAWDCCQNADRVLLLRQNPMGITQLQARMNLTQGEVEILLGARQGEALMKVGNSEWVHVQFEVPYQQLKAWDTQADGEGGSSNSSSLLDWWDSEYYDYEFEDNVAPVA